MTATLESLRDVATTYLGPIGLRLLLALVVFVLGRLLARSMVGGLTRLMERSEVDVSLRKFLGDVLYAVLLVAVVTASLDTVGVKTTAVVAVLGAAGLAVGLALQGSLSNFAAGVMLIVLRPYKVDDQVAIGKYVGRVDAIKVFNTVLVTADNREITIPNGQIIGAPIENLSTLGTRRLDLIVTVAHGSDLAEVKRRLEAALAAEARLEATPAPSLAVAEITEAGVRFTVRPWTAAASYGEVASAVIEGIRGSMEGSGVKYAVALAG
jgi:small conductance mechanosensitive channel